MPGIILSCKTFGVLSPLYEDIPFPGPLHDLQQVDTRRRTALIHVLSRLPHRRATSADRSRPTGRMITPTLGSRFSQGGKGPRTANCLAEEATTIFGSGSLRAVQDASVCGESEAIARCLRAIRVNPRRACQPSPCSWALEHLGGGCERPCIMPTTSASSLDDLAPHRCARSWPAIGLSIETPQGRSGTSGRRRARHSGLNMPQRRHSAVLPSPSRLHGSQTTSS